MKVTLSLTHRCNLACRYCYAGQVSKRDMTLVTAQKMADFAAANALPGKTIDLCFFGGEPFLCFDLIRQITGYVRELESRTGKFFHLSVTTNGTLLTQPMLDFVRQEGISLCISIDGPRHVHDLNRRYRDGRGSHTEVLKNLRKALGQLDYVQVNAVYGPDTIDSLPDSVSFFTQLGVSAIHLNPNICASWTEVTYPKMAQAYMQIGEHYIGSYERGQEIAINLIDSKMLLLLQGGYRAEDMCGMAETEWGVAPSGNVYPCERFIGEDNDSWLCLGNIHTSLDETRRCAVLSKRGNRNQECAACHLREYCMNWCGCTNYSMTGHTDLAGPALCASERAAIQTAKHVFTTLAELDNEVFISHLMRYMHGGAIANSVQERKGATLWRKS